MGRLITLAQAREMERQKYIEFVRRRRLDYLQRKHRISKEQSDEQLKRHLSDTLDLFSRIGSVYQTPEGVTVCSMRGPR